MDMTKLERARRYEAAHGAEIAPGERPAFHLTSRVGWLNDPNGFSVYRGEYHLFYQYHPYSTLWGPMHWGHCKSRDLLHWEYLPAALAPDMPYDSAGCFSGSAAALPDGRHLLMYTGVREELRPDGSTDRRQTQCLAFGDGVNYEKYPGNPVLTAADLPAGSSTEDFRDPKLWFEDGGWYAVAGSRPADGSGSVVLFRSEDALHWRFVRVLERCSHEYGKMWECPDFFALDETQVLIVSPQEMLARGLEFHNGNSSICLTGSWNRETGEFTRREVHSLDYGLDFYAPQTTLTPDGRRVMIGWMQSWESYHSQPPGCKWFGMMTVPRELSVRNGRLLQAPVRELEQYRTSPVAYHSVPVRHPVQLPGVRGRVMDLTVTLRPDGEGLYSHFRLTAAGDDRFHTSLTYRPGEGMLTIDRTFSGFPQDILHLRQAPVRHRNGELKLRLLLDRFSIEVFVNDGEQTLSSTLYTPLSADAVSFEADGGAVMDVEKYDIEV